MSNDKELCQLYSNNKIALEGRTHLAAKSRKHSVEAVTCWVTENQSECFSSVPNSSIIDSRDAAESAICAVLSFFKSEYPNCSIHWFTGPQPQSEIEKSLVEHNFQEIDSEPVMAVDLADADNDRAAQYGKLLKEIEGLVVEQVRTEADVNEWVKTWAFEGPQSLIDEWTAIYRTMARETPPSEFTMFVGRQNGKAVGTGYVYCVAGIASVQYICTRPEYRRQGIGTVLTLHAMRLASNYGCRVAVLTASDHGIRVYRSLGFKECGHERLFIYKPSGCEGTERCDH